MLTKHNYVYHMALIQHIFWNIRDTIQRQLSLKAVIV